MKETILAQLPENHPWKEHIFWFDTIDSTNNEAKRMAREGAPEGTTVIAGGQSAGRGRLGRSFCSPAGQGVYFSCILRPQCRPEQIMHLTCAAAIAAAQAVQDVSGILPGIKWTNDLVVGKRKLGGILTEISVDPKNRLVEYAVIGIGINCSQKDADFDEAIRDMACSILGVTGRGADPAALYGALICRFSELSQDILTKKADIMALYRENCVTVGQAISVVRGDAIRHGKALSVEDDGALRVAYDDGTEASVASGEVSIRGMYGYL